MDDVVLQVNAALSAANQLGAGGKSLGTLREQPKARSSMVGRYLRLNRTTERRIVGGQGLTGFMGCIVCRTATDEQREKQSDKQGLFGSHGAYPSGWR